MTVILGKITNDTKHRLSIIIKLIDTYDAILETMGPLMMKPKSTKSITSKNLIANNPRISGGTDFIEVEIKIIGIRGKKVLHRQIKHRGQSFIVSKLIR